MNKTTTLTVEQGRQLLAKGNLKGEKKKYTHHESDLQQACITWFRSQHSKYGKLLFAIPNGGARSKLEAKIMVGEGVVPGVADLMLAVPKTKIHNNGPMSSILTLCHGLFIEMKAGKNTMSEHQKQFERQVVSVGYRYVVCRSVDEFMKTINEYLE